MTKRYTGGVVSSSLPTVNAAGASGVFNLSQQADAQSKNAWPPFKVEKSLRFRASNSAYLSRTPAVAGNQKTWTWSAWVKRGSLGANRTLLHAYDGSASRRAQFLFNTSDQFEVNQGGSSSSAIGTSTAVFRDPSAWYHIVLSANYGSSAFTFYVNGVSQAMTYSTSVNNENGQINGAWAHQIGSQTTSNLFDGYVSEVNFVDGLALTPSSFGATDKDGNWSPIAYTGTYGQNGFYLNFKDASSTSTIGYDYSGNGNNWASSGISVTSGVTYDSMIDVPEDQADGTANNRGNYCTLNSLLSGGTLSNANLSTVNNDTTVYGTFAVTSGKWYWEYTITSIGSSGGQVQLGVSKTTNRKTDGTWGGTDVFGYMNNGNKYGDSSNVAYGASYVANDVIGVALDMDNYTLTFYKNNASQGTAFSGSQISSYELTPFFYGYVATTSAHINFGQRPFTYTPPSGFKALNTYNLPEPAIKQPNKHFDATLWTGTGSSLAITNSGTFQPDFVWIKGRSNATQHCLYDAIRGPRVELLTNSTSAEIAEAAGSSLTAFNTNGFQLGTDNGTAGSVNNTGYTYVAWQWKGATSNTTNTTGGLTSVIRVNQTAGFSVVTYTGNLTSAGTASVGHGLGVAPSMIIFKARNATTSWPVQHISLAANNTLNLSGTNLSLDQTSNGNLPKPTASVFYTNWTTGMNINGNTQVAYCFAPIAGYSAFGSYTGNGSTDGPFIYTGFRPKWIMYKATSGSAYYWSIYDSSRDTYNVSSKLLYPNVSNAEESYSYLDILSNGYKIRAAGNLNDSGSNYVYAAFAEMPFKYARSK